MGKAIAVLVCVLLVSCAAGNGGVKQSSGGGIQALEHAVGERPDDARLRERLARAYIARFEKTGEPVFRERAISHLSLLVERNNNCDGTTAMLYRVIASRGVEYGRHDDIATLRDMLARCGSLRDAGVMPPSLVRYLYQNTDESSSYPDAIDLLRASIKENPEYPTAHVLLANAYHEASKPELAFAVARQARRKFPDNAWVLAQYGELVLDKLWWNSECYVRDGGELDEAAEALKAAVPAYSGNPVFRNKLSLALRLTGRFDMALFEARRAYELSDSKSAISELVSALLAAGRKGEAIELIHSLGAVYVRNESDSTESPLSVGKDDADTGEGITLGNVYRVRGFDNTGMALAWTRYLAETYAITGQWQKAYELFTLLERTSVEMDIGLYIRLLNAQKMVKGSDPARASLKDRFFRYDLDSGQRRIYEYFMGELTPAGLLAGVNNVCEKTRALYHIGVDFLSRGDREEADKYFSQALETPAYGDPAYVGARYLHGVQ